MLGSEGTSASDRHGNRARVNQSWAHSSAPCTATSTWRFELSRDDFSNSLPDMAILITGRFAFPVAGRAYPFTGAGAGFQRDQELPRHVHRRKDEHDRIPRPGLGQHEPAGDVRDQKDRHDGPTDQRRTVRATAM